MLCILEHVPVILKRLIGLILLVRMWMCDQLADGQADWILSPVCPVTVWSST